MVPPLLDEDLVFRGSPKRARQPLPANTPWALSLPRLSRVCHARADTSWGEDSVRAARASRRCCRTAMPSAAACQLRVHRPRYHRHIRRCSPLHESPPKDTRASGRPASGREAQMEAFLGPAALHALCSGCARQQPWSADARLGMGLAFLFAGASACACLKRRGHEGGGRDPCLAASDTIITPFIQ